MIGDDVVVMLDARCAFAGLPDAGVDIFWGAYLGTPDEVLVAGDLAAVKDEIVAVPARERARKGWIMEHVPAAAAFNVLLLGQGVRPRPDGSPAAGGRVAEDRAHLVATQARSRCHSCPRGTCGLGGFGDAAGLTGWLRDHHTDAVVDATHPFATR